MYDIKVNEGYIILKLMRDIRVSTNLENLENLENPRNFMTPMENLENPWNL